MLSNTDPRNDVIFGYERKQKLVSACSQKDSPSLPPAGGPCVPASGPLPEARDFEGSAQDLSCSWHRALLDREFSCRSWDQTEPLFQEIEGQSGPSGDRSRKGCDPRAGRVARNSLSRRAQCQEQLRSCAEPSNSRASGRGPEAGTHVHPADRGILFKPYRQGVFF